MKRIIGLLLCVTLLLGVSSVLSGCGDEEDKGAYISVSLGDVVFDLDPTEYYVSDNVAQILSLVYEPLFKLNKRGKVKLAAAEEYEIDKEERTIVITLRESYWSNGARVTADDFIYAWRDRILSPNRPNAAAPLFYGIENALEVKQGTADINTFGAMRTGVYEITISYLEGQDPMQILKNLASVATAPVYQPTVAAAPETWSKIGASCTTNGAFRVAQFDTNGAFTLTRNEGYHQPTTAKKLDKFVRPWTVATFWNNDEEVKLTYASIQSKTIFFIGNPDLADLKENKKKATVVDSLSTYSYVFNSENPLFADPHVRYALSLALDREAIATAVTFGKAATGLLPTAMDKDFDIKTLSTGAKLAEAEAELAKANITGISKAFTLTVAGDAVSRAISEIAKANWEALGFTVTIKYAESIHTELKNEKGEVTDEFDDDGIQKLIRDASYGIRNYDCIAVDLQMYSTDPFVALCAFTSEMNGNGVVFSGETNTPVSRANIAAYQNETYDNLIKEAMNKSGKAREELLRQAETLLVTDAPVIPVLFNQNGAYIARQLRKVTTDGFGNFVFTNAKLRSYKKYLPTE